MWEVDSFSSNVRISCACFWTLRLKCPFFVWESDVCGGQNQLDCPLHCGHCYIERQRSYRSVFLPHQKQSVLWLWAFLLLVLGALSGIIISIFVFSPYGKLFFDHSIRQMCRRRGRTLGEILPTVGVGGVLLSLTNDFRPASFSQVFFFCVRGGMNKRKTFWMVIRFSFSFFGENAPREGTTIREVNT